MGKPFSFLLKLVIAMVCLSVLPANGRSHDDRRKEVLSGLIKSGLMGLQQSSGANRPRPQMPVNYSQKPVRYQMPTPSYSYPRAETGSDKRRADAEDRQSAPSGFMKWLGAFHSWTFKPLHRFTKAYVSWVRGRFNNNDEDHLYRALLLFLGPVVVLAIFWALIRRGSISKGQVLHRSLLCWAILWIAYDGGYSLSATFFSMLKGFGTLLVIMIVPAMFMGLGSSGSSATSSSSDDSQGGNGGGGSCGGSSTWGSSDSSHSSGDHDDEIITIYKDKSDREYVGQGRDPDVLERTTPGDTATFDHHNDGTSKGYWESRYTDEIYREE